jgi:PAS domain S-box-containing protein
MPRKPAKLPANQALVEALPVAAVLTAEGWDKGGAPIVFANREFCELTGYTPADLKGRNTRLLHGPRTDVALLRHGRPTADATGRGQGEGWLSRKDGTEFYARWKYRPLKGTGGPLVVVYQDHSELWRQREALLRSQKLGTVGLLAGGVAHDFNNLLSVINGYCEIMGPKIGASPAARKDLNEIHRAGLKASAIARQILEFSRRHDTETGVVNFNTLIREVADIIRRICGENIEVQLRLASDLGNARINPVHFQQVLLNLCFNARDAMPKGGQLTLRTFNQISELDGAHQVALEVSDTGTGIEPALHDRIFEPFYTTKREGTGLGLPTSQGLIAQAGGKLGVRSAPGRGTTFAVFLPETAESEDSGAIPLGELPTTTQGTESILLIEQDEGLRKMISGILAIDGYSVCEAATAEEAVTREVQPQLIIADTATKQGVTCLRRLRKKSAETRFLSTAAERPTFGRRAEDRSAHLPKPFALSSLLTQVRELLDKGSR